MNISELKTSLHRLIEEVDNSKILEFLHSYLVQNSSESGVLWQALSDSQKTEVLEAYEESEKTEDLIPHSEVVKKFK